VIAALALSLLLQGAAEPVRAPSVTARVSPEFPAVGEPITVELRVNAPTGTLVRFPVLPDTGSRIEPLDPRIVRAESLADGVLQVAMYRLIAWDTGSVAVQFGDITVERDGRTTRYPVAVGPLRIHSVLPRDSSSHAPRPARGPLDAPSMPWRWWVAAAVVAALAWWGWRRWHAHRDEQATLDPGAYARARDGLAHVRAMELLAAGEPGRHLLAQVDVLRRYLAERFPALSRALTAAELDQRLREEEFPILPERLVAVVERAEAVAYARAPVATADAERTGIEAATIIEELEMAARARTARETASSRIRRKRLR
jgi:hypothetical protein